MMADPSWIVVALWVAMFEARRELPTRLGNEVFCATERRTNGTAL